MKERPILFNAPMVRAIIAGTKTQTRRPVKPQPCEEWGAIQGPELYNQAVVDRDGNEVEGPEVFGIYSDDGERGLVAPFAPGDRLWVRETWAPCNHFGRETALASPLYRATFPPSVEERHDAGMIEPPSRWRPSIHMPRRFARLLLDVVNVRVERVQDISEADAIAEGVERIGGQYSCTPWRNYLLKPGAPHAMNHSIARASFSSLWESVYGPESWQRSDWVWVVEFKKAEVA